MELASKIIFKRLNHYIPDLPPFFDVEFDQINLILYFKFIKLKVHFNYKF